MRHIKVTYDDGDTMETNINGTDAEICAYYIGNTFNVGIGPDDNIKTAVAVEFLAPALKLKPEYSTQKYDYITTANGRDCTAQAGISKGILCNVSAVNDGVAHIWTINAWGKMYTDTIAVDLLQERV